MTYIHRTWTSGAVVHARVVHTTSSTDRTTGPDKLYRVQAAARAEEGEAWGVLFQKMGLSRIARCRRETETAGLAGGYFRLCLLPPSAL